MHIKLNEKDMSLVRAAQRFYAHVKPVPVRISTADIVRLGLRELVKRLATTDPNARKVCNEIEVEEVVDQLFEEMSPVV